MKLKSGFVRTVKEPGRYGDGRGGWGLALLVRPRADRGVRKSWIQRIRINGRPTNLGLGVYPIIGLREARKRAIENLRLVEQGIDPRGGGIPTFREAAETVIQIHRPGWKKGSTSEQTWRRTLNTYVDPFLGTKRVDRITTNDIMNVLVPIWHEKPVTAKLTKQKISTIMRWAIAAGHRLNNPAGDAISAGLPKNTRRVQHHRALPHNQVAAALSKIRRSGAHPRGVRALEFQVLTAVRPTEARLARWAEIDLKKAIWTIPAQRTKKDLEHRVPLSTQAIAVLTAARRYSRDSELVFVGKKGGQVGSSTIAALLQRAEIGCVPHGFRSSFRNWVEECTDTRRSVAEAALAHVNRNQVEAAYLRTDLFDLRRKLMETWANYLDQTPTPQEGLPSPE